MLSELIDHFERPVAARGRSYFLQGRVSIGTVTPNAASATVRGHGGRYQTEVRVDGKDGLARVDCTCPHAGGGNLCKHIAATICKLWSHGSPLLAGVDRVALGSGPVQQVRDWRHTLSGAVASQRSGGRPTDPRELGELWYVTELDDTAARSRLKVVVCGRKERGAKLTPVAVRTSDLPGLRGVDAAICSLLVGVAASARGREHDDRADGYDQSNSGYWIRSPGVAVIARLLAESGRWLVTPSLKAAPPSPIDASRLEARVATVRLIGTLNEDGDSADFRPWVVGGGESFALTRGDAVVGSGAGIAFVDGRVLRVDGIGTGVGILRAMAGQGVVVARADAGPFYSAMQRLGLREAIEWPSQWAVREERMVPRARVKIEKSSSLAGLGRSVTIEFVYGETRVSAGTADNWVTRTTDGGEVLLTTRDEAEERRLLEFIERCGVSRLGWGSSSQLSYLMDSVLSRAVTLLIEAGVDVWVDGVSRSRPTSKSIQVVSGTDWFDLRIDMKFGNASPEAGEILRALREGTRWVKLSGGGTGLLPEDWSGTGLRWLLSGEPGRDANTVRLSKAQFTLAGEALGDAAEVSYDEKATALRLKLRDVDRARPLKPGRAFKGELRAYQQEGLGWLGFLEQLGLGGILADEMGLGKTVQVLSHISRSRKAGDRPWLVVVPKSLVHNWLSEAARFTPKLSTLAYTGPERASLVPQLMTTDLVVTTYGTARTDPELAGIRWRTVVLDEAQAIKNAASATAKAVRAIGAMADHRLAMTGTPIENGIEDLWSIMDFLNPGMLGGLTRFRELRGNPQEHQTALRRALRPFILRRTKAHVAPELPPRTEQIVRVPLEGRQLKLYNSLRDEYRRQLLGDGGTLDSLGLNKSRMHVLEALLRLRQAACHPALLQSAGAAATSSPAKFEALFELLEEVRGAGKKALVFSQFTGLLDLVGDALRKNGVAYERLDGSISAKARKEAVQRFQSDGGATVFLVSLKAGGVGLNLTSAEYVFLLDPWWNPATEDQAIGRAHRIGQRQPVTAYRILAAGTVEDKIAELQSKKRDLAAAIVGDGSGTGTGGTFAALTREDVEWLLH